MNKSFSSAAVLPLALMACIATGAAGPVPAFGAGLISEGAGIVDAQAPVLASFDFSPKSIDLTSGSREVVVTAHVMDATGVRPPLVSLSSVSTTQSVGFGEMTKVSGTDTDAVFERRITLPVTADPGEWRVQMQPLSDSLGNEESALTGFHTAAQRLVVTDRSRVVVDRAAPVLTSFDFSPKSIDLATGSREVVVTAHVMDATGVKAPVVSLSSVSTTQSVGFGEMTKVSGTDTDAVFERRITLPMTADPGEWRVQMQPLSDSLGNEESALTGFHTASGLLIVSDSSRVVAPDRSAPVLTSFDFSPKTVDLAGGPREVVVTAHVTDATGVKPPMVSVSSASTTQSLDFGAMERVSGTPTDGVFQRRIQVPAGTSLGEWRVSMQPLRDSLGNEESGLTGFHTHPAMLQVLNSTVSSTPSVTASPSSSPSVPPVSTPALSAGVLSLSGTPRVNAPIKVLSTAWKPTGVTLTYQWARVSGSSVVAIAGATSASYTPMPADRGQRLRVTVVGKRAGSEAASASTTSGIVEAGSLSASVPTVKGTARVGLKLTATAGSWTPGPVALRYQWYRGTAVIKGATQQTYTLSAADRAQRIKVAVSGSKAGFTTISRTSASSSAVSTGILTVTPTPKISGKNQKGATLAASAGAWGPAPVAVNYQWFRVTSRGTVVIKGATKPQYVLSSADRGQKVKVIVTGSKAGYGSISRSSSVTAKIV